MKVIKRYTRGAAEEKGTKRRRGPVLFRWFVSYLAILVIPLIFSIAVYFYSLHIINRNSKEIYESSLEQIRIEVDNYFDGVSQILQQLSLNTDIQVLTLVKDSLQPRDQWTLVESIAEIKKARLIFPLIEDIFVVLNPLDSVITTSAYMTLDLFYHLYYENEDIGLEEFKTMMRDPRRNEIRLVKDKILILKATTMGFLGDNSATLVIACQKEKFDSRYLNMYENNGGRIFIVNKNNQLVFSSDENGTIPSFQGSTGLMDGLSCRVLSLDSRIMNWRYLYFIPERLEKAQARQIQFFTFAGLLVCSFFCVFLSYWLTKRHYDPVKKLMAVFSRPERMDKGEDEFGWMEKKAMDTQRALGNNLQILRKYCVNKLLEKPFDPVQGKQEMERYRISLEGEWNTVTIFLIPDFPAAGRALLENEGDIISAVQYVIIHIFTEAVGDRFKVEMTDVGEHVAAIINWSGDKESFITGLEEIIEYTQQEAGAFLHLSILNALGEPRRGPEGIYYSNLEARETQMHLDAKTGQTILHYRDIKYSDGGYQYTQETEQKLINLIRAGDAEAACATLRQVWAENANPPGLSGRMIRLLAYNILGSLIKGTEQDGGLAEDPLPPEYRDFNFENIPSDRLIDTLEKAAMDICHANALLRQSRRKHQLSGKVKQYIDENFKNPDINISITSLHFGMNPVYLSAVFKEETGISLLEYINTLRIEEGKKLLKSGFEVNKAAERSGFQGSGAFIRVFKKLTGITPGQYKEMNG
jgi:AraC-like DNA-binding protein